MIMRFLQAVEKKYTDTQNYTKLKRQNVSYKEFPQIRGVINVRTNGGEISIGASNKWISRYSGNPVGQGASIGLYTKPNGFIKIGDCVGISNALIYSAISIEIEDYVLVGGGVQIFDTNFHSLDFEERMLLGDNRIDHAPVVIKRGAFIGANSIILKGVTIGEQSIIGAASVVSKDVPSGEIWAGNPAKFIRNLKMK